MLRYYIKNLKNLIQHLSMLSSNTNYTFKFTVFFQFFNKRSHFYRFRSCSKYSYYFNFLHFYSPLLVN